MAGEKLNHDQRMFVLRMYAEGHSCSEIKAELHSRCSITMAVNSIQDTCNAKKYQNFIQEFKELYLAAVKSVPIANKRIRLDDKEKIRLQLNKMLSENKCKTKADKAEYLSVVGRLNMIHAETREEMEKKPQFIANVAMGNMGSVSDDELHKRQNELLKRIEGSFDGRTAGAGTDTSDIAAEGQG